MKTRMLAAISILLLALIAINATSSSKASAELTVHADLIEPDDLTQPTIIPVEEPNFPPTSNEDRSEIPDDLGSTSTDLDTTQLFPTHMDPITSCQTSLGGPFGKDVEIFMGGDVGYRIDRTPEWMAGSVIPATNSSSNVAAIAAGSEKIVAAWKDGSTVWYDLWKTSEANPNGAWVGSEDLGLQADGDPAIIARSTNQWEVFARQGDHLVTSIVTDTYKAASANWLQIEGVNNAASDPVVVSANPQHTGVFYLDDLGHVWFTEWTGGWAWRDQPIPLVDTWVTYLPSVVTGQFGAKITGQKSLIPSSNTASLSKSKQFQVLNAVSRNENHMAVFGVDLDHRLWVRQWNQSKTDDWSDTQWVQLMEGVALEKPGVASRHSNHIGVAVRDMTGHPTYIEWNPGTGWTSATPIPALTGGDLFGGLTLAAMGTDAYWLFGVDQAGQVRKIAWDEETGWDAWETLGSGMAPDQTLSAPVRRFMDVMPLGHTDGGQIKYFHFTDLESEFTSTEMVPQPSNPYLPRGQALAWVNGGVIHVAGRKSELGPPHFWEVEAREMVETAPMTDTLLLANHDYLAYNQALSLATGDLDYDGSDEAVMVTQSSSEYYGTGVTMLSVLDFDLGSSITINRVVSKLVSTEVNDFSVEIGDLDGDGRRDEIAIAGVDKDLGVLGFVYRYHPETQQLEEIDQGVLIPFDEPKPAAEVETAIGRLYPPDPSNADPSQQYLGEQLAVLTSYRLLYGIGINIKTFTLNPTTDELANVDTFDDESFYYCTCDTNVYRSAVDAGDLNGDGYDEIAAWYASVISSINPRTGYRETDIFDQGIPDQDVVLSLSVGDIDLDGRAEVLAGGKQALSIYEILGDDHLARTRYQQWDPSWGSANAVLTGDLDHDTFYSQLVGCDTFREARVAVVVNGAPRWYENGVPIHHSLGSFSLSKGGNYSSETGTSHSWGTSFEFGAVSPIHVPLLGDIGEIRASIVREYLHTVNQSTTRDTELIYGTDYKFDDTSLGQLILNVRSYTCNYFDLFPPEEPQSTARAMVCNPELHTKEFHSLDWWLTSGNLGDYAYSWADVGHTSPAGVHTNNLQEPRNYPNSLPVGYRVVYTWAGGDIPLICGDQYPQTVVWWAEDATGFAQGKEVSLDENTSVSAGWTLLSVSMDYTESFGDGRRASETFGWKQTVGFSGGVTQFYDNPNDPGDDRLCYRIVPYVYQARAQTIGGFTYPYLELDYYVECIGCGSE